MLTWFGKGWAQPVTKRRWALAATVLFQIQRMTGHRLDGKWHHRAWQRSHS